MLTTPDSVDKKRIKQQQNRNIQPVATQKLKITQ
jgi:hypothetical protein